MTSFQLDHNWANAQYVIPGEWLLESIKLLEKIKSKGLSVPEIRKYTEDRTQDGFLYFRSQNGPNIIEFNSFRQCFYFLNEHLRGENIIEKYGR